MKIQFVCLLLLLLSANVLSQNAKIKSRYQKFQNQHIIKKMNATNCDDVMQTRNISKGNTNKCKETNTFIIGNIKPVKSICEGKGEPWRNQMTKSLKRFDIVVCKLKKQKARPARCLYRGKELNMKIIIKCEKGFPVHYDRDIEYLF
uniref:Ribonuclease A-domain domain-containing protein n=1 Tax=Anabas testudineus TaxID=64144 RepID=A0A3Q1IJA4_ANATE